MSRENTVVFTFPLDAERPKAIEIHKFLKTIVKLETQEVLCIQLDATVKRFFVKLCSVERCDAVVARQSGKYEFVYPCGLVVTVDARHSSGLGRRLVRVFDIPIEASNACVATALGGFGSIVAVKNEVWSFDGYFECPNGVRQVTIDLAKPIPSFVPVGKYGKVMLSYSGQTSTCALCDEPGHNRGDCPRRRRPRGWENPPKFMQPASATVNKGQGNGPDAQVSVLRVKPAN